MRFACRLATWPAAGFAHPLAVVGLLLASLLYWHWHHAAIGDPGVFALSIFALTTTQLVLFAQDRDTKALHAKLDALVRGVPEADGSVLGIEGR